VPNLASPQVVGERMVWTAMADGCGAQPVYQFLVGPSGGAIRVVRDFAAGNSFTWAPMQEGAYVVRAIVKDGFDAASSISIDMNYTVISRVTGTEAVITPTANPLVALYSAPPCAEGTMYVQFRPAGGPADAPWVSTDSKPCLPGLSTNFLVAGMLANTTYEMEHVTSRGTSVPRLFTTGVPPVALIFPQFTVRQAPGPHSDLSQNMVFHMALSGSTPAVNILATDLLGRVEWYYDPVASGLPSTFATSLLPGGTLLLQDGAAGYGAVLREADLAGNSLRETNVDAINAQLKTRGRHSIDSVHHDAVRLPDGKTAVLADTVRTVNVHGAPVECQGDMVIVLDENFQVTWSWDAFDYLDVNRDPIGESTSPPVDWLHTNAVAWSPTDGNLILSVRHQDWVIKINYNRGLGDGSIIWRLGKDGDFTINSADPYPWFSHQHNVHYVGDQTLAIYDNGNTRCSNDPACHSRGQLLYLNEQNRTAIPLLNTDLGNYALAVGAAQTLPNGNAVFTSGFLGFPAGPTSAQSIEVLPDGTKAYVLEAGAWEYRTYRMSSLYPRSVSTSSTSTVLRSSSNPAGLNQSVTWTATVSPIPALPGTVTFRDGTAILGTAPLALTGERQSL